MFLQDTEGSVGLVDISDKLPGLVYQQGVNCWKVSGKNKYFGNSSEEMELYSSYEDVPDHFKSQITKTMFPPTADEAEKYHLERFVTPFIYAIVAIWFYGTIRSLPKYGYGKY